MKQKTTTMITICIPLSLHKKAKEEKVNMSSISRKAIEIAVKNSEQLTQTLKGEL